MNRGAEIRVVRPNASCRDGYVRGLRAFQREGLAWHLGVDPASVEQDFAAFVRAKLAEASPRAGALVSRTHLWALVDGEFAGSLSLRHALDDALRIEGGHIGYETVPAFRGAGVATEMLRQALPVARALGLREVLLTCDDSNAASIRVIERNDGVLQAMKASGADGVLKRYYRITL